MAQYEADKIMQLLQFCSWKARTEMSHTGLLELTSKLGTLPDGNEQTPNEKYLVDLLSDARGAVKRDNILTKRKSYIDLLLKFGAFDGWKHWKDTLYAANEYIQTGNLDFSTLAELKVAIWIPESLTKQLTPTLTTVKHTAGYAIDIIKCPDEVPSAYVSTLVDHLSEYALIIWAIPMEWKDLPNQMTSPNWQELAATGRIIPVWIQSENIWQTAPPFIPALKPAQIIGGISGVLTSLLYIQELLNERFDKRQSESSETSPHALPGNNHFHDHSFGIFDSKVKQTFNNTVQHIANQNHHSDRNT